MFEELFYDCMKVWVTPYEAKFDPAVKYRWVLSFLIESMNY